MFAKRQLALSCAGVVFTLLMTALTIVHFVAVGRVAVSVLHQSALIAFAAIVLLLVYGSLVHQCARGAYFARLLRHKPASRGVLEHVHDRTPPPLTILIPSYKEELAVLRMTILSAALVEYPNRDVVVLL